MLKVSFEKAEKVVKPPRRPMKTNALEESENNPLESERWAKRPMKKQPRRFTMKVP
jgi:hypothetical protein